MKIRTLMLLLLTALVLPAFAQKHIYRGLTARECPDGSAFISWRMLETDDQDVAFLLTRRTVGDPGSFEDLKLVNNGNINNFADKDVEQGKSYQYYLFDKKRPRRAIQKTSLKITGKAKPYISIPLKGNYDFQKIAIGDLDGDGEFEYVIKQPNFNTDPYQKPGYWKKSIDTYKLEAYDGNGRFMWRYDMGWSIEAGIWYSPWIVYDIDGDGKAEIYCKAGEGDPRDEKGLVQSGAEWLVKLDGQTGKVVAKTDWLSRDGFSSYNYYCRNFLTVAYLDGVNPSLVMQRGTYRLIKMQALDKDFNKLWYWDAKQDGPYKKYRGQSSHGLISADVDQDGKDELVMGAAVIDNDGTGLWTLAMGHPDECYCADIDLNNPGLEIFYGFETRQKTDGFCVVDAKTGKKLWTHKEPTKHLHGQGMCGDVLADFPGMEVYGGERDSKDRWLYSAKGELIKLYQGGTLSPRPVWWDADPTKEVVMNGAIRDWGQEAMQKIEGRLIVVVDCIGDHREEVITTVKGKGVKKGELRIYSTTIPSTTMRPCLMQDRQYRLGVCAQTMGYYYPAQLGLKK